MPMAELSEILGELKLENVRTYIQSGNIVFQSRGKIDGGFSEKISTSIESTKGLRPETLVLSLDELIAAIDNNPFPISNGKILNCFFLKESSNEPDMKSLEALKQDTEQFKLAGMVFYLFTPNGFAGSKLARRVEKVLGVPVTARNWNTVNKLHLMALEKV